MQVGATAAVVYLSITSRFCLAGMNRANGADYVICMMRKGIFLLFHLLVQTTEDERPAGQVTRQQSNGARDAEDGNERKRKTERCEELLN